jgi:hypothetical protein
VERDFVEPRYRAQPFDVGYDARMQRPQDRSQVLDQGAAFSNTFFVEVVAEDVHAVRPRQVVKDVAVWISHGHPARGHHETSELQVLAQDPAELERHAVEARELQVGEALARLLRDGAAAPEALRVQDRQALQGRPSLRNHRVRGAVRVEELVLRVRVRGNQSRDAFGEPHVSGKRGVLGARKLEPPFCERHEGKGGGTADSDEFVHG